ncbi:MAG: cytochrome C peroxidase [Marinobacter adhaerens]|uniref:Cytochrome C peroxidase n=1 Tax=Marinobacter adhaerens TaxID=1033846 RepID=A0A844I0J4_9GAMM|nr:cytochrome C peroxidase [Marinobacter adhaerens]
MSTIHPLRKAIRSSYEHQRTAWWSAVLVTAMLGAGGLAAATCGPCAPCKNQCKAGQQCGAGCKAGCNPCAAKNPCATKNPCASKNPCATKGCNPCAAGGKCGAKPNPCAAKKVTRPPNYQPYEGNPCKLMALGKKLFNDTSLSSNGLSCATCHNDGAGYNATFAKAYPHSVAMAKNIFGIESVHLDEMIQICMVQPMATEPLEWSGEQLAALTQYMASVQKQLSENPCALKGSKCGACGPCAGKNPCATKNPCAGKNPCSASNGRLRTDVAA